MSSPADKILLAGINDAEASIEMLSSFNAHWQLFADACRLQQLDIAHEHGQRLVAVVETAVDLYLSSVRRMAQFERLTMERDT